MNNIINVCRGILFYFVLVFLFNSCAIENYINFKGEPKLETLRNSSVLFEYGMYPDEITKHFYPLYVYQRELNYYTLWLDISDRTYSIEKIVLSQIIVLDNCDTIYKSNPQIEFKVTNENYFNKNVFSYKTDEAIIQFSKKYKRDLGLKCDVIIYYNDGNIQPVELRRILICDKGFYIGSLIYALFFYGG